ncbi:MAG: hypothetical protein IT320_12100 [Anaerolineae bacterium]|nr:hypothetical protein [Anaerolineae bacterium]
MQFDLSRLTLEEIKRYNAAAKINNLIELAAILDKSFVENGVPKPDFVGGKFVDLQRATKAFNEADKALAKSTPATEGVEVRLDDITTLQMHDFYAAVNVGDFEATCDVMRQYSEPWPTGYLSYAEYMGMLKAFMEAVKKTALT